MCHLWPSFLYIPLVFATVLNFLPQQEKEHVYWRRIWVEYGWRDDTVRHRPSVQPAGPPVTSPSVVTLYSTR